MNTQLEPLTSQQRRFCVEYATLRNGTRAYINSYPECSYGSARTLAAKLLTNVRIAVADEVEAVERENAKKAKITARKVLRELANVAFNDVSAAFEEDPNNNGLPSPKPLGLIDPATRRTIQSVKVKRRNVRSVAGTQVFVEEIEYRFADKLEALDKLCKHLGLTNDGSALESLLALLRGPEGRIGIAPAGSTSGGSTAIEAGEPDGDGTGTDDGVT